MAQEDLNTFLAVAEDLKVKGLTQNQGGSSSSKPEVKSKPPDRELKRSAPAARAPTMAELVARLGTSPRYGGDVGMGAGGSGA